MKKKIIWIVIALILIAVVYEGFNTNSKVTPSNKVKIGVILPMTGPAAPVVEDLRKTFEIYNRQSKNIEFVYQDDQCSGKGAVSAYNLLKAQGVRVYIGACSGSILALAPILKEDGNLMVSGFGGSIDIRKTGDEVIRFIPDGLSIADKLVEVIKKEPNKKYALFYEQQDYPKSIVDKLNSEVGSQIIFSDTYKGEDLSFQTQIIKIKNSKADSLIFIPVNDKSPKIIYSEMKKLGFTIPILGEVNMCDHALPTDYGLHGVCFNTVMNTDGYKEYVKNFNQEFGHDPLYPFYNAASLDVLYALDEGLSGAQLNKQNVLNDGSIERLKESILDGVRGIVGNYSFTKDGEITNTEEYLQRVEF